MKTLRTLRKLDSKETLEKIACDYLKGASLRYLSKEYGMDRSSIIRRLIEYKVTIRKRIKFTINDKYFNRIDSEDKAYFLGFLFADGCNFKDKKGTAVMLKLHKEDKYILDVFCKYIETNKPLTKIESANQYMLRINNKNISYSLEKLGMVPRKSLVLKFPEINEKLLWHFIRGYFDGDGYIGIFKRSDHGTKGLKISLCGSEIFCNELKKIFDEKLHIKSYVRFHGGIYNIDIKSNLSSKKFLEKIYDKSKKDLRLVRKFELFERALNEIQFIRGKRKR